MEEDVTANELLAKLDEISKMGIYSINANERLKELHKLKSEIEVLKKSKKIKRLLKVFKALSNSNRILMLLLISRGVHCSCELETLMNLSQSTVSHHLSILLDAELIEIDKKGKWSFFHTKTGLSQDFLEDLIEKITS